MRKDWCGSEQAVLRMVGGMVANDLAMQALADQLAAPFDQLIIPETTTYGAAYLAGLSAGLWVKSAEFAQQ